MHVAPAQQIQEAVERRPRMADSAAAAAMMTVSV
jgi:hypothetical protein